MQPEHVLFTVQHDRSYLLNFIHPPRVFVLDDEPVITESMVRVLERGGYEAYGRCSSSEILDLASEKTPDLLITDVALGPDNINGIDVAIYFERFIPECKAILISGDPNTAELHRRYRRGGHNFMLVHKPIHPRDLLQIVGDQLAHLRRAA
jgi:DNA-binding NtrC family response regulator